MKTKANRPQAVQDYLIARAAEKRIRRAAKKAEARRRNPPPTPS